MISKVCSNDSDNPFVRVTFVVPGSIWADNIYLVGDFDNWARHARPMRRNQAGDWELEMVLPRDMSYQFRYLRDDREWMTDGQADGYAISALDAQHVCVLSTAFDHSEESMAERPGAPVWRMGGREHSPGQEQTTALALSTARAR